ncbi:MAG: hypothetical protein ACJ8AI_12185 [Rhodopila sp.]
MLATAVRSWFGRTPATTTTSATTPVVASHAPAPELPALAQPPPKTPWPPARLAVTDRLWGQGFNFPGGEPEGLRLTRSLGLSPANSLLLGGGGGAACAVAREFGA